ncbi:MAG: NADPH-dependent F420 reductase [Bauldia sp.]
MASSERPTIAILGGTGNLGIGLATRWLAAGYQVILGSRDREKAIKAALALRAGSSGSISGATNLDAARDGAIVVVAVPYASHHAVLAEVAPVVAGKIVIDAVVPLIPPKVSTVQLPPEGSAAVAARRILGDGVRVTSAFHNVSAAKLQAMGPVDCDVLVFGDDKEARDAVISLAAAAGLRGIDGGGLANSVAAEALTAVLIGINRRHKVPGAGIRITGLSAADAG